MAAKLTPWFLVRKDGYPTRKGFYDCGIRLYSSGPVMAWRLEWDGIGFLVPCPMYVHQWRGLASKPRA
jgi:hypothetical protein